MSMKKGRFRSSGKEKEEGGDEETERAQRKAKTEDRKGKYHRKLKEG